jgi:radical SAM protein with 4Fe4S-binding SPASM domain
MSDELTHDEWLQLIEDLATLGCQEICLLGGEPFLYPGWQELLQAAVAHNIAPLMITNGFLIDETRVSILKTYLDRIGVSLDGASPEVHDRIRGTSGSFERAWRAITLLRDAGIEVGAITTVSSYNFADLERLKDLLLDQDVSWQIQIASSHGGRFSAQHVTTPAQHYHVGELISAWRATYPISRLPVACSHDIGYWSAQLCDYSETSQPWAGCYAGLSTVGICSNGAVKGCLSMDDAYIEGNVRERSLLEIWRDPNCFARNRAFTPDQLSGFCAECQHGASCRAGCADTARSSTQAAFENRYCFYRYEQKHNCVESEPALQVTVGET